MLAHGQVEQAPPAVKVGTSAGTQVECKNAFGSSRALDNRADTFVVPQKKRAVPHVRMRQIPDVIQAKDRPDRLAPYTVDYEFRPTFSKQS